MKKILFVFIILIGANAFARGIKFEHISFDKALAKAEKEGKMVFMDCYTEWCGPCKYLSTTIFPQDEVGAYFNANFINIKVDMEKGEGPELLKRYDIKGFPTLLFLDADGRVLFKRVGGGSAENLIADAKMAADPMERLDYVQQEYEAGDRSKALVTKYIALLRKNYLQNQLNTVGKAYLDDLSNDDLLDKDNIRAYMAVGGIPGSEKFEFLCSNKDKFVALSSVDEVEMFITVSYYSALTEASQGESLEYLDALVEAYKNASADPATHQMISSMYSSFYMKNEMYAKLLENKKEEVAQKNGSDNYYSTLVNSAYLLIKTENLSDIDGATTTVHSWLKTALELNPDEAQTYYCYALLYRYLGDKKMAQVNMSKGDDKVKKSGEEDDQYIIDLRSSIQNM